MLAHELTHVQNRDVMIMTIASFFASIASFIVQMGFWFGLGFDDDDDNGPGIPGRDPRLRGRLPGLVRPDPDAVALPGVRRRSRLGDHHRAPELAQLGAAEDQRLDGSDPAARPARRLGRARRVLHLPAEGQAERLEPVLDAPAARGAARGAGAGSRRSCRAPPADGTARCPDRQAQAGQARPGPAVRDQRPPT